jgi:hypothetical protein
MWINAEFTMQSTNRSGGSLARVGYIGASLRISTFNNFSTSALDQTFPFRSA